MDAKEWREIEPAGPQPAGDVGGDDQLTKAFSRRWGRELPSGEWAIVEVTTYGLAGDEWRTMQIDVDDIICTDPKDVGGTEVWSAGHGDYVPDVALTDEGAKQACGAYAFETEWDGQVYAQ